MSPSIIIDVIGKGPRGCDDELHMVPTLEEHPLEKILHEIPRVIKSRREALDGFAQWVERQPTD